MNEEFQTGTDSAAAPTEEALVSIRNLKTWFFTDEGVVKAVDGVDYDIPKGKTLGVVGESGCGKSVTALSILRLIPDPPGKIVEGEILFEGRDLVQCTESEMRRVRGNDISMIFQEPMTSLNPVFTVGDQIMEAIILHQRKSRAEAREMAIEFLHKVGIPSAEVRIDEYPHQMSGGMKQRVMIAMALSCYPKLLIADEPSTALDVTIQAQILDLMRRLQEEFGMSILLITHDLGVVAEMADHVVVMYASKIVESANAVELFKNPHHPYTIGLFKSIPHLGAKKEKLDVIPGVVPNPLYFPSGCKFRTRCPLAWEKCMEEPTLEEVLPGHFVACWCQDIAQEKLADRFAPPEAD
ncbi:MAG: ABC transporter ATP-binding protein [Planctomycetota bacterium]|jgi:oligopeptide/dipeptide ABC transporter ATP-binding protein